MRRILRILGVATLATMTLGLSVGPRGANNPGRTVTFEVAVTDKNNNPVVGLKRENFRVFEDKVEQSISRFDVDRRPLAVVILVEFSETISDYGADALEPANEVFRLLQPEDWAAIVSFSSMPRIVTDFTHDKRELVADLRGIRMPLYRDAALFDAVYFLLGRMRETEEKGAVVLLASGLDTLSTRKTIGDVLKLAEGSDTPIYAVSYRQSSRFNSVEPYPDPGASIRLDEAEYALGELAEVSGGLLFTPMFPGQYRRISETVVTDLRNRYVISFVSTAAKAESRLRTLKVEVGGTDIDENGKPDKLKVRHKKGYHGSSFGKANAIDQ